MVYCTYNMLNMFRALLCPSSWARDPMCVITVYGVRCLGCWWSEVRCRAADYASGMRYIARPLVCVCVSMCVCVCVCVCVWRLWSVRVWRRVIGRLAADVRKVRVAVDQTEWTRTDGFWKWSHYDPSKRRELLTQRYSVTSQVTWAFSHNVGQSVAHGTPPLSFFSLVTYLVCYAWSVFCLFTSNEYSFLLRTVESNNINILQNCVMYS